ncbi:MAG: HdeD family acid-resistance protein [Candidatus Omnitrophica bacterium]|nr:HdeD family acid-resistance protein [Candidatus Omnitrophota bacterium]
MIATQKGDIMDTLHKAKSWFIGGGILLLILGVAAIVLPVVAAVAVEVLFGWILILSGIVTIVHSFRALSTGRCILRFLIGLIYLAIGTTFLVYPLTGVLTLSLFLAILFIVDGVFKTAVALQLRPLSGWGWMLASGIVALMLAGIIFSGFPGEVAWMLGLIVGINLIFSGWSMIMLGSSVKIK